MRKHSHILLNGTRHKINTIRLSSKSAYNCFGLIGSALLVLLLIYTFMKSSSMIVYLNWWKGKPSGSIACTRKQKPRFYWSCSSVVTNDATPLCLSNRYCWWPNIFLYRCEPRFALGCVINWYLPNTYPP